jgi:POT family proton-dependent oligopeptide transporter
MTHSDSINPLVSNADYFEAFNQTGLYALVAAILLLLLSSKIDKFVTTAPDSCDDNYHVMNV